MERNKKKLSEIFELGLLIFLAWYVFSGVGLVLYGKVIAPKPENVIETNQSLREKVATIAKEFGVKQNIDNVSFIDNCNGCRARIYSNSTNASIFFEKEYSDDDYLIKHELAHLTEPKWIGEWETIFILFIFVLATILVIVGIKQYGWNYNISDNRIIFYLAIVSFYSLVYGGELWAYFWSEISEFLLASIILFGGGARFIQLTYNEMKRIGQNAREKK